MSGIRQRTPTTTDPTMVIRPCIRPVFLLSFIFVFIADTTLVDAHFVRNEAWRQRRRIDVGWFGRRCQIVVAVEHILHLSGGAAESTRALDNTTTSAVQATIEGTIEAQDASAMLDCPVTSISAMPKGRVDDSTSTGTRIRSWKESLPGRLRMKGSRTFQKIRLGTTDIYLLGTAHVSNDSSTDVRRLLDHVKPDCIFVELCDSRIPLLEGSNNSNNISSSAESEPSDMVARAVHSNDTSTDAPVPPKKLSFWQRLQSAQQAQGSGSRWQALSTVLLSDVQEDYAEELGVELGGEFRCAHAYWKRAWNEATTVNDRSSHSRRRVHLVLGDRPLHLTLVRAWESLTFWPKAKVIAGLLWSSLRRPNKEEIRKWLRSVMEDESDVLTQSFEELRQHFPTLYTTIISERDAWLAAKLVQTCRALQARPSSNDNPSLIHRPASPPRTSIVAIVGAGHVPGICDWLTNTTSPDGAATKTPESVLSTLVTTRRWANDDMVQNNAIPMWIHDVSALPEPDIAVSSEESGNSIR